MRTSLWSVLAAIVCTSVFAYAAEPDVAQEKMATYWEQFQHIKSIHCKATLTQNNPVLTTAAHGSFEYWEDGGKYRTTQLLDAPGMSNDVRWNGELCQWLAVDSNTLYIAKEYERPNAIVNEASPFLPFEFLHTFNGPNSGKRFTLDEIRDRQTRDSLKSLHSIAKDGSEAEFPGDKFLQFNSTWRISFGAQPSFLPTKLQCVLSNGVVIGEMELSYEPLQSQWGPLYFPKTIKGFARTAYGLDMGNHACVVEQMDVNVPISVLIFEPDYQKATSVIDVDRQRRAATRSAATQDSEQLRQPTNHRESSADASLDIRTNLTWPTWELLAMLGGALFVAAALLFGFKGHIKSEVL